MKASRWTEASFHGGITVSLLFCTPKMSIVQCDHMVGRGSLGNSPTISKREFPQFSLAVPGFLSKSLGNLTSKQSKPPFTTLLLVISFWSITKLPAKAGISWAGVPWWQCLELQDAGCYSRSVATIPGAQVRGGSRCAAPVPEVCQAEPWAACLSRPCYLHCCTGAWGLRPACLSTEYHCESEVLHDFRANSTGFSTLVFGRTQMCLCSIFSNRGTPQSSLDASNLHAEAGKDV